MRPLVSRTITAITVVLAVVAIVILSGYEIDFAGVTISGISSANASTDNQARLWLSWDKEKTVRDVSLADVTSGLYGLEQASSPKLDLTLYLVAESPAPIDSIGLNLRWATCEMSGDLSLLGVRAATENQDARDMPRGSSDSGLEKIAGQAPMQDGVYSPLDHWSIGSEFLTRIEEQTAAGMYRYVVEMDMVLAGARTLKMLASGISIKHRSGDYQRPGIVSASIGVGWAIEMPPLITEVRGVLNRRAVYSRVTIDGNDLDRLVRLAVVDGNQRRLLPLKVIGHSRDNMVLKFPTKIPRLGMCDLEIGGPNGWISVLPTAIHADTLNTLQPYDEVLEVNVEGAIDE